ncbi:hypothetical protein G7Y79_00010g028050 [Physcia stellaris]|nr:hypothetical protein G7Y79_00010g028050 [Physcia stellaris]
MSPPTPKALARAQLQPINTASATALSNLKASLITKTDLMDTELSTAISAALDDYETKYLSLKAALDASLAGLKAAYMKELDARCEEYRKAHGEIFEGYLNQKLALAREEGYWGLGWEEVREVLGIGKGKGRGGEGLEADRGITALGSEGAAFVRETEMDAKEKGRSRVGSKETASSPETEMDVKEKSRTSVVSKEATSTSSLETRVPGTKERPAYEQKVMVLDSDQMAALEAKMANVMRRRH